MLLNLSVSCVLESVRRVFSSTMVFMVFWCMGKRSLLLYVVVMNWAYSWIVCRV